MTRSVSGPKINVKLSGTYQNALNDAAIVSITQPTLNYTKTLTNGVSASQINRIWESRNRVLANATQEIIDLFHFTGVDIGAGDGKDALGLDLEIEEIVAIAIVNENLVTDSGQLEILPSNSRGWQGIGTHTVATGGALHGQGCLFKSDVSEAGFDIEGINSRITLRASGGSVTYSIYVMGRSDDEESSSSSSSTSSMSTSSTSGSSSSSSSVSSISTSSESSSSSSISTSSISTSSASTSISSLSSKSSKSSSSSSLSGSSLSSSSTSSKSSASSLSASSNSSSSQSESSSSIS